jgi:hypothetical protein
MFTGTYITQATISFCVSNLKLIFKLAQKQCKLSHEKMTLQCKNIPPFEPTIFGSRGGDDTTPTTPPVRISLPISGTLQRDSEAQNQYPERFFLNFECKGILPHR